MGWFRHIVSLSLVPKNASGRAILDGFVHPFLRVIFQRGHLNVIRRVVQKDLRADLDADATENAFAQLDDGNFHAGLLMYLSWNISLGCRGFELLTYLFPEFGAGFDSFRIRCILDSNSGFHDIKLHGFKLLLNKLDRFAAPAIGSESAGNLVFGFQPFHVGQEIGYCGKQSVVQGG